MYRTLFRQQIKYAARHPAASGNLTTNIIFGVLFTLMILNFLTLGLLIKEILETIAPGKDPVVVFNSIFLYYFIADFILRLLFQQVPGMGIKPYLLLPIKKRTIVHFLLSKSAWSIFPLIPLLFIIPFYFQILRNDVSLVSSLCWFFSLLFLFNFMTYAVLYLKRLIGSNPGFIGVLIGLFILLIYLGAQGFFSITEASSSIFGAVLNKPWLVLIPAIMFAAAYLLNYNYLYRHTYPEELQTRGSKEDKFRQYSLLKKYGEAGELIALELKLIFRNKRPRSTIFLMLGFLLLGWPFFKYYIPLYLPQSKYADYRQDHIPRPASDESLVTFIVSSEAIPPLEQVCISGEQDFLGQWRADRIPLELNEDSTWTRTFAIRKGTLLKYKITGADWNNEALYEPGVIPDAFETEIKMDTTINIHVSSWSTGAIDNIVHLFTLYASIFFTGVILMGYGQMLLGWEGSYFDFILVQKIDYAKYLQTKYFLMAAGTTFGMVLMIPYLFFGETIRNIMLASFLYNVGVNANLLLYLSTNMRTRINLSDGVFSMQGKSGMQVLNVLLMLLIPIAIFGFTASKVSVEAGLYTLWILGIAGIIVHPLILKMTVTRFLKKKYIMGAAFRQK